MHYWVWHPVLRCHWQGRDCVGKVETRDVAPKAKVLRCHRHHALCGSGGGMSVGGGVFEFGPNLIHGVTSIYERGGKQRSCCS